MTSSHRSVLTGLGKDALAAASTLEMVGCVASLRKTMISDKTLGVLFWLAISLAVLSIVWTAVTTRMAIHDDVRRADQVRVRVRGGRSQAGGLLNSG
jgi:hypothetical protein